MTKGRQSTQVCTRPRAAFQSRFISQCLTTLHTWWSRFQTIEGNMFQKDDTHEDLSRFWRFLESPHLIFIASCIPKILLLNTFHLPKFLNICSWSGDVEVNAKACQFDTWRPMCDITHFGRINVGKNTCGKIGEEVLMRSFSLGSHRSSQPSSTRNSLLFGYVNRGRDLFGRVFNNWQRAFVRYDIYYVLSITGAVKFTKNKNDQWNNAGGFATNISTSLSLKMQLQRDWLTCGARCMSCEPPNADSRTPMAFWGLGFGQLKAFWPNPRHQHLLGRDPLNSVGW